MTRRERTEAAWAAFDERHGGMQDEWTYTVNLAYQLSMELCDGQGVDDLHELLIKFIEDAAEAPSEDD